mgnify:CR=1 FL=1
MNKPANLNDIGDLLFYTNRALQCEIRADMREISFAYSNKERRFILYIYYDRPLTQEELDYDIAGTIIAELSTYFHDSDDVLWEDRIIILPYPQRLPNKGICVYSRYEPSPKDE